MSMDFEKKTLPLGYEDFKEVIDEQLYFVDKTMFIRDIIRNKSKNNLITRPRRFGKTLNLSMLKYFFDITEKENAYLFDGLKLSEYYDELGRYRNTHPVISLSMKCAKQPSFRNAVYNLCVEIRSQFRRHKYILKSDTVDMYDKNDFETMLSAEPDALRFNESIKLLSSCLYQYYGTKVIILIDEYDVPLESAYFSGYYDEMVSFIRSLFESALKTNPALEFSVITGCLRISKESIFTGLNNLDVNTILSGLYSEYFGFLQPEVDELMSYYSITEKMPEMKRWYDGYMFGKTEVYNPWSVISQTKAWNLDRDAFAAAWWANSSSNNIIRTLVGKSDAETREALERLMNGGSIETHLSETVTYGDLTYGDENIWSFLFFTGYLKLNNVVKSGEETGEQAVYSLTIPNLEIKSCYREIIMQYFDRCKKEVDREALLKALLDGDAEGFAEQISKLLKRSISFYDNKESFYHGLVSGLLTGAGDYKVESNRETGSGRSDLILCQQGRFINAVILEFKVCRENEEIDKAAKRALEQIDERGYAAEPETRGYRNIIKYGVAFKDKLCYAVMG